MRKKSQETRDQVIEAAIKLFNTNGYNGTSVRAIASEAGVNVALVSYYFGGKKGLLEHLMSTFLEGYIKEIEMVVNESDNASISEALVNIADRLITYQQSNFYLSRFVHREITIDTMLIRELMMTYLMKEKYLLNRLFEKGMKQKELKRLPVDLMVIHFREMLILPFLQPQYVREVYSLMPEEAHFKKRYLKYIRQWIDNTKFNTYLDKAFI